MLCPFCACEDEFREENARQEGCEHEASAEPRHADRLCAGFNAGQNLELQIEALQKAGCKKIFQDRMSGSRAERPGLAQARDGLRTGDTLVVGNWIGWAVASSIWSIW